ncbi:hypothetical protein EWM64_g1844 [Hericium alpestre]|uniref:Major facilitator superfamily (MFS) profile domain-containing protein n=1 Tax=Hericium alpestre TaxID=135208 RepID=A0A4Z0A544_9AGAM|nr:hypothetical protein EWM64_g1844 [Hericium alpestre]
MPFSRVSRVPTLLQAGYVVGLLFITPMGDLVRRRPLVIASVAISASLSIGLASTGSVVAFEALSFLTGVFTVASPILIPLAADLAPPERRASAMSIVLSGYLLGIVIARVLAGVIAEFSSWRIVYYVAVGVQYAACLGLYAFCPDYPAKNTDITYFGILWTMAKLAVTEPLLVQTYLILLLSDVSYITFWVTLTFILGQSPYHYSTLVIGLFGLIGLFGVSMAPLIGRFIDRLVPWYSALLGTILLITFWAIETGAAGINIAAVVVVCLGLDFSDTMQQLSLMSSVLSIEEGARSRLNAVIILAVRPQLYHNFVKLTIYQKFIGQLIGTSVSTKIYVDDGWRPAAAFGLGCMGLQLLLLLLRGPHCERYTWLGYQGGYGWRRSWGREVENALNEQLEDKDIE